MLKILLAVILITPSAFAASDAGVPIEFIKLQIYNFIAFALVVFFISRSKIAPVYKKIKEDYIKDSEAAARKLADAKARRDELAHKLENLELGYQAAIEKADLDARALYKSKMLDTKDSVSAMNKDLESQIEGLKRSQSGELKNLLMNKSIDELKTDLKGEVDEALLMKLQDKFVHNVDVRA
jgi:F0F1-type ATP synthase membrane subunit b/b'